MSKYGEFFDDIKFDGLVSDVKEQVIGTETVRKLGTAGTLKRGTILALSSGTAGDGKCVILGTTAAENETLTAFCILAEDTEVGTSADVKAPVYKAGVFDMAKCTVKTGYTVTKGDLVELEKIGVRFKAVQA